MDSASTIPYEALLVVSFGGPQNRDEVIPFLENVLRGRNVPRARMLEVAEHYYHFGGRSPINQQNRELIAALEAEFARHGPRLPVYWGNRNWHPFLTDTMRRMQADGVRRALAFITSIFGSYSGCRQYLEDIERARAAAGPGAPEIDRLRSFYNHPGFVEPMIDRVEAAFAEIPVASRHEACLVFTAHSIPVAMAESSPYVRQLREACRLVAEGAGGREWRLVYQSRSGPPGQPWLEPDICGYLRELASGGEVHDVVVVPIGFISDHLEVLYDLDTEARAVAEGFGLNMVRAGTVGTHPKFISMVRELMLERMGEVRERRALGAFGPAPDVCAADCCPPPSVGPHARV